MTTQDPHQNCEKLSDEDTGVCNHDLPRGILVLDLITRDGPYAETNLVLDDYGNLVESDTEDTHIAI